MKKPRRLAASFVVTLAAAAGCGGASEEIHANPPGPEPEVHANPPAPMPTDAPSAAPSGAPAAPAAPAPPAAKP